jgi:hypothetical protein
VLADAGSGIYYRQRRLSGIEAAAVLIAKQLAGIRRVTQLGAVFGLVEALHTLQRALEQHDGAVASVRISRCPA